MTVFAISGARILADGNWFDDHAIVVDSGRIRAIVVNADIPKDMDVQQLDGGMLLPGFIDTQVNGGAGILFNDVPSVDSIITIANAHRRFGTTAMLPTLISDDLDVIAAAIHAVDQAIAHGVPGIIGIHIEGPFLNERKRGIHNSDKFRILDGAAIALLSSLNSGKTLITLAPELAPPGSIRALVDAGVTVAAGHSIASYDDMQRAIAEGVTGITHLFNAMSPLDSRAPGMVGAAFDSDLICGIIIDGFHVHPASLRSAYRAKGANGLMIVTDAMPTVGSATPHFQIGDTQIKLDDGKLRSADGTLAGSHLNMALAVKNCCELMHVDLPHASQMASATPAKLMGLADSYGQIATGYRADFVLINDAYEVQSTWIDGERRME
jgi:N-acetylglucosamine-6-phosphate deacetylase